jgi:hypothetical protein
MLISASVHAGLTGETIRASYFVPTGTVFTPGEFSVKNFVVVDGVESSNFGTTKNIQIDIGDDYLELMSLFNGRTNYDVGQYKFSLINPNLSFTSIQAIDTGLNIYTTNNTPVQFDQSRVSFTPTEITLSMAGLSVPGYVPIKFFIQTSAVPEPSTLNMLMVAAPFFVFAASRRRVAG